MCELHQTFEVLGYSTTLTPASLLLFAVFGLGVVVLIQLHRVEQSNGGGK